MDTIWEEFINQLETILPGCTSRFVNADHAAIEKFESDIGISLPADFKRYLQLSGGRKDHGPALPILRVFSFLSLTETRTVPVVRCLTPHFTSLHCKMNIVNVYLAKSLPLPYVCLL
jgi:cell wall assembly regulator SMI1